MSVPSERLTVATCDCAACRFLIFNEAAREAARQARIAAFGRAFLLARIGAFTLPTVGDLSRGGPVIERTAADA